MLTSLGDATPGHKMAQISDGLSDELPPYYLLGNRLSNVEKTSSFGLKDNSVDVRWRVIRRCGSQK